jgi:hypothetical protein
MAVMVFAAGLMMAGAVVEPLSAQTGMRRERAHARRDMGRLPGQHAGDWLRRYKDLPPNQREMMLESDADFQRLPPERQERLRERLRRFYSLPVERQQRILDRMETWEHLTPEQKDQARDLFRRLRQLPEDRRRMVAAAVGDLRQMPAEQRQQAVQSERFASKFSAQERELLGGIAQLPLAPAETGKENETPDQD